MNEQQIWYVLIFSIPFIPAIAVFFMIKPEPGDARVVGGSIPILKDMKIELGGAIATYVVIALVGFLGYYIIVQDKRLEVELVPVDENGIQYDAASIRLDELVDSNFRIEVSTGPERNYSVSAADFRVVEAPSRLLGQGSVYVRDIRKNAEDALFFRAVGGLFTEDTVRAELSVDGRYTIDVRIRSEFIVEWIAAFDGRWDSIGTDEHTIHRVMLLRDNSDTGLRPITFGLQNIPGIRKFDVSVYSVDEQLADAFIADFAMSSTNLDASAVDRIGQLVGSFVSEHSALEISSGSWISERAEGLERIEASPGSVVQMRFAPSPKIVLPTAEKGQLVLVVMNFEGSAPDPTDVRPYGFGQHFSTEKMFLQIESVNFVSNSLPRITFPGRDSPKATDITWFRDEGFFAMSHPLMPLGSEITVPL